MLARSARSLSSPQLSRIVFDRTPLDYLACLTAIGADPGDEADAATLRPAFASLGLLVVTLITPETEQTLAAAEMPLLRSAMNNAMVDLVHTDPWTCQNPGNARFCPRTRHPDECLFLLRGGNPGSFPRPLMST